MVIYSVILITLSGFAMAAGNAHCVRSWVPKDRHPVGAAEGCGPQVRELGLRPGSSPGLGSSPGEGNGNLLQYSCLENPMDGRAQ